MSKGLLHLSGRHKESAIWEFFDYDMANDKSMCLVKISAHGASSSSVTACNRKLAGQNPTNLKSHLRTCHKDAFQEYEAKEKKRIAMTVSSKSASKMHPAATAKPQKTLDAFCGEKLWSSSNHHQQKLELAVAAYFSCCTDPIRRAGDPAFIQLLQEFQPKFKPPGPNKIMKMLNKRRRNGEEVIKKLVTEARKISICLDIWTRKSLTASFLGISGCFYSEACNMPVHAFLALCTVKHPHTGQMVADCLSETLKKWSIPATRILHIITDNGSNMLKAVKIMNEAVQNATVIDDSFDETQDRKEEDEGSEDECEESDVEEMSEREVEQPEQDDVMDPVIEILDALKYNRMACLPHTIQLVIKEIDKHAACNNVLTKARALVRKVRKSSTLVEKLLLKTGKTLVMSCPTRWNSTLSMLHRMQEVKLPLTEILDEEGIDGLLASEWATIDDITKLMEPFAIYTDILQADCKALSAIIPAIMDMESHLECSGRFKQISAKMLKEIKSRFSCIMDAGSQQFNPIPAAATLLDPTLPPALYLAGNESLLAAARRFVLEQASIMLHKCDVVNTSLQLALAVAQTFKNYKIG